MNIRELTEGTRCWKGYEKKGTKKMFGKTVPNCVKKESLKEYKDDLKFSHDSDVDIPRNKMPQIKGKDLESEYKVIKVKDLPINSIKPTQSQRVPGKVQDFIDRLTAGTKKKKPLIVDKNGYLINGHHHLDAYKHVGKKKVKAYIVDATIHDIVDKFSHTASDEVALEASGYIPSEKEKNDPRFKTALTVDVRPDSLKKNAAAFGSKIARSGVPPIADPSGKSARAIKPKK